MPVNNFYEKALASTENILTPACSAFQTSRKKSSRSMASKKNKTLDQDRLLQSARNRKSLAFQPPLECVKPE